MKKIFYLLLTLFVINSFCTAQTDENIIEINRLVKLQKELKDIHPALAKLYPVAVFKDSTFKIYDFIPAEKSYQLIKTVPSLRPVIKGIRAAYPLEENDYKMTCVVSDDAFENLKDYAVIFHEFVHCYQAETIEYELKDSISIYKKEIDAKNYMWEINYPFPYNDSVITQTYNNFIGQLDNGSLTGAEKIHDELKARLSDYNYQYLIWVEWKEGSARWIENMIREKLKVDENVAGNKGELSRVSFYYGGSNYIKLLSEKYKTQNLKDLFELIYNK